MRCNLNDIRTADATKDEPFWTGNITTRTIPKADRTEAWLKETTAGLYTAAQTGHFAVTPKDIRKRLAECEHVVVAYHNGLVVGFVATSSVTRLPQTGLNARYICGAIINPNAPGRGKFYRLMSTLPTVDVEVLHTQNPAMGLAFRHRGEAIFPSPQQDRSLTRTMTDDIHALVAQLGRATPFDPMTGIALGHYGHCLYSQWPLPGAPYYGSFAHMIGDPASAVVMVAFHDAQAAHIGLRCKLEEVA